MTLTNQSVSVKVDQRFEHPRDSLMAWRASISAMGQNSVVFPAKTRQIKRPIIYVAHERNHDLPILSACSLSSCCKLLGS